MIPWYQVYEYKTPVDKHLGLSPNPEVDRQYLMEQAEISGFRILSEPLPLGHAFRQYKTLRNRSTLPDVSLESSVKVKVADASVEVMVANTSVEGAGAVASVEGAYPSVKPGWVSLRSGYFPLEQLATTLGRLLAGRILLWEELGTIVEQAAARGLEGMELLVCNQGALLEVLQLLTWWGQAAVVPAVDERCNRCGNSDIKWTPCQVCSPEGEICRGCYQCEACISMGVSRSCVPLWRFSSPRKVTGNHPVQICLDFQLTLAQQQAAEKVLERIIAPCNILVVAACGAGKTEITFEAIARTLRRGGRVLFAIPRRDVVRDLEPRLKQAFPGVRCITLYGGSSERFADGELIIATTHQVIRFYQCFDLVILDEVDAYPYRDSAMLHYGVQRAVRQDGNMILMTATPTQNLLKLVKGGRTTAKEWELVTIPARHHGYPVPMPVLLVDRQLVKAWSAGIRLSDEVMALIHSSLETGRRLFVFVPAIKLAGQVADYLKAKLGDNCLVESVHSRATDRDKLIAAFKEGMINILVTTTIMERGVTVPNCDVLVLLADLEKIFDSGTLVQMAGRAGRVTAYPTGKVWFAGGSVSGAMRQAVANIEKLNTLARQGGFLKQGY